MIIGEFLLRPQTDARARQRNSNTGGLSIRTRQVFVNVGVSVEGITGLGEYKIGGDSRMGSLRNEEIYLECQSECVCGCVCVLS